MKPAKWLIPLLLTAAFIQPVQATAPQQDFTQVATKAIPAVVSIKVKSKPAADTNRQDFDDMFGHSELFRQFFRVPETPKTQMGQGSGFIISPDGYVITNCHVVKDTTEIKVVLNDSREFDAKIIGIDQNADVALIKIDAKDLPFLSLGDSEKLQVGQWVVAIGNPLGLQASLTVGVVSAKGRNNLDITQIEDFIQTDAAINRGNSGGPLLDLNSQVIGMNTAIVSNMGSGHMGIGFAIPSSMINHIVGQLRNTGSVSRGFMGVYMQQVDRDLAEAFGMESPQGALVGDLAADSPAAKAGIRQGDILLKHNQVPITNIGALRNKIAMMLPGTEVKFTVLRNKKMIEVPVIIGAHPDEEAAPNTLERDLGLQVANLNADLAKKLGAPQDTGVVINQIDQGSLAAWAGLAKGTIVLEVNRTPIASVESFKKALTSTPAGSPILLLVKQGDLTRYISLKVKS
jgi:serine protease Do